MILRLQVKGT